MAASKSIHSAASSAAGYLYQARLALAECLRFAYVDSGIDIAIEKLDDVSFEKEGGALELLQTKHHVNRVGNLSDTSVDLWKTLRVWADATKADPSLPGRTRFSIITTARAPDESAASLLRPAATNPARNPEQAEMGHASECFGFVKDWVEKRVVLNAWVTKTTAAEILANPATRRRQVTMTISLNPLRYIDCC